MSGQLPYDTSKKDRALKMAPRNPQNKIQKRFTAISFPFCPEHLRTTTLITRSKFSATRCQRVYFNIGQQRYDLCPNVREMRRLKFHQCGSLDSHHRPTCDALQDNQANVEMPNQNLNVNGHLPYHPIFPFSADCKERRAQSQASWQHHSVMKGCLIFMTVFGGGLAPLTLPRSCPFSAFMTRRNPAAAVTTLA